MATPSGSSANGKAGHTNKRRRVSSPSSSSANNINERLKSGEASLVTPPPSAPETMSLKLIIPQPSPTKEDQRTLAIREAAAKRWIPKLQKPFPKSKEISEAYKLKLMRHYPSPIMAFEPNFVKPHVDVSPRVTELLRRFPKVHTSTPDKCVSTLDIAPIADTKPREINFTRETNKTLIRNKLITSHEKSKRFAWQCFSSTDRDRIDRGREAMMESGLGADDLAKESQGLNNELPSWRKVRTGMYAKEARIQQWNMGCSPSNGLGPDEQNDNYWLGESHTN
jgi:hypothetical protein